MWILTYYRDHKDICLLLWENPLATFSSEDRTFDYLSDSTLVSASPLRRLGNDPELNEKPSHGSHELRGSVCEKSKDRDESKGALHSRHD